MTKNEHLQYAVCWSGVQLFLKKKFFDGKSNQKQWQRKKNFFLQILREGTRKKFFFLSFFLSLFLSFSLTPFPVKTQNSMSYGSFCSRESSPSFQPMTQWRISSNMNIHWFLENTICFNFIDIECRKNLQSVVIYMFIINMTQNLW